MRILLVVAMVGLLSTACSDGLDPRRVLDGDPVVSASPTAPATSAPTQSEGQPSQPDDPGNPLTDDVRPGLDDPVAGMPGANNPGTDNRGTDSRGTDAEDSCESGARADIDRTIGGQLAAFAAADFSLALSYATPDFRSAFDVQTFRSLIVTDFPIPAEARSHRIAACAQEGTVATAIVQVTAAVGTQTLQYLLEEVDGTWLIGGAVPLTGDGATDGPVI